MKSKLFTIFVVCTTFFGFTSVQLEAVSALPNLFVVALTRGTVNTIVLSTNTMSSILDTLISSTAGVDTQFIGYIEYNCTENDATPASLIKLIQSEPALLGAYTGFYALLQGYQSGASVTPQIQALTINSNVTVASTPNAPTYQAGTALTATSGSANLTAAATAAYTNFIGVLTVYAADSLRNSISTGTYQGTFVVTFGT